MAAKTGLKPSAYAAPSRNSPPLHLRCGGATASTVLTFSFHSRTQIFPTISPGPREPRFACVVSETCSSLSRLTGLEAGRTMPLNGGSLSSHGKVLWPLPHRRSTRRRRDGCGLFGLRYCPGTQSRDQGRG